MGLFDPDCYLCRDNPKETLGGTHGGISDAGLGVIKCTTCGIVARLKDGKVIAHESPGFFLEKSFYIDAF